MNQSKPIILAGSGRSGTTWLGNIISANPNIGIIFEPFYHRKVAEMEKIPLFKYAREDEENLELYKRVSAVLSGQISNDWVNQQQRRTHFLVKRFLVKTIRANLMLAWIDKHFDVDIVFTLRHPCAVILSRVKLDWTTQLSHFLNQKQLVEDHLHPFLQVIHDNQKDELSQQAVVWCLENLIPLKQMHDHNWTLCLYEDMVRYPLYESKKILDQLHIANSLLTKRAICNVSMVTRPDSPLFNGLDPLSNWQNKLSKDQVRKILNILEKFEIGLYTDAPLPHKGWLSHSQFLHTKSTKVSESKLPIFA